MSDTVPIRRLSTGVPRLMRGRAPLPGLHTFRITDRGLQVFPRLIAGPPAPPLADGKGKTKGRLTVMMTAELKDSYTRMGHSQGLLTGRPHLVSPGSRLTPRRPDARRPKS